MGLGFGEFASELAPDGGSKSGYFVILFCTKEPLFTRLRPSLNMVGRAAASHSAVSANNQQQNSRKEQNGPMAQRHNAESFEAWRKNVLASSNDDQRGRETFASLMLAVAPIE